MMLLTREIERKLFANGVTSAQAIMRDGDTPDHKPVVKLFTPDGQATWLLSEFEVEFPEGNDPPFATGRAFGLCDLGQGFPELGYVNLTELRAIRDGYGLPVERDKYFRASKRLAEYAEEARKAGRIAA